MEPELMISGKHSAMGSYKTREGLLRPSAQMKMGVSLEPNSRNWVWKGERLFWWKRREVSKWRTWKLQTWWRFSGWWKRPHATSILWRTIHSGGKVPSYDANTDTFHWPILSMIMIPISFLGIIYLFYYILFYSIFLLLWLFILFYFSFN